MKHLSFWVWLLHSMSFPGSSHLYAYFIMPFFSHWIVFHSAYVPHIYYTFIRRHFSYFYSLAIVNRVTMNIFEWNRISFSYIQGVVHLVYRCLRIFKGIVLKFFLASLQLLNNNKLGFSFPCLIYSICEFFILIFNILTKVIWNQTIPTYRKKYYTICIVLILAVHRSSITLVIK